MNKISYANDKMLIAKTSATLQSKFEKLNTKSKKDEIKINVKNIKGMQIGRSDY